MALVEITLMDSNTVEVKFNLAAQRYEKLHIKRDKVRTVAKLTSDGGVELIMADSNIEQLHYTYVDKVGANTSITSNEILFNELTNIFDGN